MAVARLKSFRAVHLITGLCILLFLNWLCAIARFQPNVMFMDQWDYFLPLFNGQGWWARFTQQQGPVREGLGFVITGWILDATSWDVRYDSVFAATVLLVATLLALRLKSKMAGPLGLRDAWIPVLCLSLGQFETVLTTPNASHSVLPLALILLAANVWLSPRPVVRYLGAGTAAVVLIFTGFGLFAGGVLAFLLGARIVRHALAREYREMWLATAGFMAVGVGWVGFARGYTFMPAVEGFRFPWTPWTDYLRFVALMLTLPTWHVGASAAHYRMGIFLALVVAAAAARITWIWGRRQTSLNHDVLVLLMGSGLLYVAMTAVGRIPLGVTGGMASRYLSLMFPLWLAVYLAAGTSRRALAVATVCVWLLAVAPYTAMARRPLTEWPGTLGLTSDVLDMMKNFGTRKAAWADVYLATGSWEAAQAAVIQPIHPNPSWSGFDDKLRFLREHRLSFFATRGDHRDYLPWLANEDFTCEASRSSPHACP
jgi:hypothetical protein